MKTIFDWMSLAVFGGLIVLFLQRSMAESKVEDKIWHYAPPALACAIANFVGNRGLEDGNVGLEILSGLILVAAIGYIFHMLKPFRQS